MSRLLAFSSGLLAVSLFSGLSAAVPLTDLVDDGVAFSVEIADASKLKSDFAASALGRTWDDPEIRRFFAPLIAEIESGEVAAKFKAETGRTPSELLAMATGRVLLALPSSIFKDMSAKHRPAADDSEDSAKTSEPTPPFILAVEVGAKAGELEGFLDESVEKEKETLRHDTEKFAGVTVHMISKNDEPDDVLAWAIRDGVWIFGSRKDAVLDALDAQAKGGLSDSLGRSRGYLDVRERLHDADFMVYVNGPALNAAVLDALPPRDPKEAANPFSLDPAVVVRALGLDSLTSLYVGGELSGEAMRSAFGLTWTERRGLLNLLAYRDGPVERPDWVGAGWTNVSTFNFSVPASIEQLLALLDTVNPVISGMAQGQIRNMNRQLGVDLQRDLIGSLGDRVVTAMIMPQDATLQAVPPHDEFDQLIAISLVDPELFQRSLDSAKRVLGPGFAKAMTERDYLGRKLFTFTPPAQGKRGFSYSVTDRWFIVSIGGAGPLESVLQSLDSRQPGFFARDDVRAAMADVPGEAFSFQFQDSRVLISALFASLIKLQGLKSGDAHRYVDPEARPSYETISRYWSGAVSYGRQDANGMHFEATTLNPTR